MVSDSLSSLLSSSFPFQSALRFAVVSDSSEAADCGGESFQSALRFAVVSDFTGVFTIALAGGFNPL